jgi:hypothetical protein
VLNVGKKPNEKFLGERNGGHAIFDGLQLEVNAKVVAVGRSEKGCDYCAGSITRKKARSGRSGLVSRE